MSMAWASALFEAGFMERPQASWRVDRLHSSSSLDFYLRYDDTFVHGQIFIHGSALAESMAAGHLALWRMQQMLSYLDVTRRMILEVRARSVPFLCGSEGVFVLRGTGVSLALELGASLPSAPVRRGMALRLRVPLWAPVRETLVVALPARESKAWPALLETEGWSRQGALWTESGALLFRMQPVWQRVESALDARPGPQDLLGELDDRVGTDGGARRYADLAVSMNELRSRRHPEGWSDVLLCVSPLPTPSDEAGWAWRARGESLAFVFECGEGVEAGVCGLGDG